MHTKTIMIGAIGLLLILTVMNVMGQSRPGLVKGIVRDTIGKQNLPSATIHILDANDSSLVSFGRSNESGSFSIGKLHYGNYILVVSYTGFNKIQQPFSVTADKPFHDFETIRMLSKKTLKDVEVTAASIVIKGDTIEYNAASFKVNKPNAVVEDLLKKLPGIEVDKSGTIKANGQEVKRVLVDGKQFFANDPKLATKNLQADMVSKVQVFDKKSDKSEFTGFDDGNSEPTINLTLKNDKRTGVFGKLSAGGGTDERFKANANVNKFRKGEQLSFIGQANNVNQQGFSLVDALSFSAGPGRSGSMNMMSGTSGLALNGMNNSNSQGINTTEAAGLNYNHFKSPNLDVNSSYFFNGTHLDNAYNTRRESFVGDTTQLYNEEGNNTKDNYNHRLNAAIDWKIDTMNSIKITPYFTYQSTTTGAHRNYSTMGVKGGLLSDGFTSTNNSQQGYNFSTTALWRHRFARKGRTFSAELKYGRNESEGDGSQFTVNNRYQNGGLYTDDTLNQQNKTEAVAGSYSANLSYTEPVSRRSLVEFITWYNHNENTNNKSTFDYNPSTGNFDWVNERLTNLFDNDYNFKGAGITYRENRKGWNYVVGARLQSAELTSFLQTTKSRISQSFLNVLPTVQLQVSKNRYRNFRFNYSGTTTQPTVAQLQPVEDVSEPPNVVAGNPDLSQSFNNNLRLSYNSFDPYTMKSFFVFLNGRQTINAIVNNDSIFPYGGKKTTYNNVNGVFNGSLNMTIGLPVKMGATKAKLNLNTYGSYVHNINLLNGDQNMINNINLTENASLTYTFKELFDITGGGGIAWNRASYSLQESQDTKYFTYTASLEFNIYLAGGFTIENDADYNKNTGRAEGYNNEYVLWNIAFSKSFLKNKRGELRLSVNDILNRNTGVSRNSNANYIEDTRYTVLKRYALLSFTYSLNKFGMIGIKKSPQVMMMRN